MLRAATVRLAASRGGRVGSVARGQPGPECKKPRIGALVNKVLIPQPREMG